MKLEIDYFNELWMAGSEEFEFIFRGLLNSDHERLYSLVEDNPSAFREALLASYYNPGLIPSLPVEQILYGYITDKEKILAQTFPVKSDKNGIVYMPRLGYFYTHFPEKELFVRYKGKGVYEILDADQNPLPEVVFKTVIYLGDSNIELTAETNPIITQFFRNPDEDLKINESEKSYTALSNALALIQKHFPFFYEWLNDTVSNIVLFNSTQRNSFASLYIKGAAFINMRNQVPNEMFFLEEITHQCGHVLFYPMSIDRQALFTCDYATPMSEISGIQADDRDVINAFYAFFPQYFGDSIFDQVLDRNLVTNEEHLAELMGRFAFRMYKYGLGVKQFDKYNHLLSEKGKEMFAIFKEGYETIYRKRKPDFDKIDVSKQVYTFDLGLFKKENQHYLAPV